MLSRAIDFRCDVRHAKDPGVSIDAQRWKFSTCARRSPRNSGSLKTHHPLDLANKYLSHPFVESPDMMNIYNGNVIAATVTLNRCCA